MRLLADGERSCHEQVQDSPPDYVTANPPAEQAPLSPAAMSRQARVPPRQPLAPVTPSRDESLQRNGQHRIVDPHPRQAGPVKSPPTAWEIRQALQSRPFGPSGGQLASQRPPLAPPPLVPAPIVLPRLSPTVAERPKTPTPAAPAPTKIPTPPKIPKPTTAGAPTQLSQQQQQQQVVQVRLQGGPAARTAALQGAIQQAASGQHSPAASPRAQPAVPQDPMGTVPSHLPTPSSDDSQFADPTADCMSLMASMPSMRDMGADLGSEPSQMGIRSLSTDEGHVNEGPASQAPLAPFSTYQSPHMQPSPPTQQFEEDARVLEVLTRLRGEVGSPRGDEPPQQMDFAPKQDENTHSLKPQSDSRRPSPPPKTSFPASAANPLFQPTMGPATGQSAAAARPSAIPSPPRHRPEPSPASPHGSSAAGLPTTPISLIPGVPPGRFRDGSASTTQSSAPALISHDGSRSPAESRLPSPPPGASPRLGSPSTQPAGAATAAGLKDSDWAATHSAPGSHTGFSLQPAAQTQVAVASPNQTAPADPADGYHAPGAAAAPTSPEVQPPSKQQGMSPEDEEMRDFAASEDACRELGDRSDAMQAGRRFMDRINASTDLDSPFEEGNPFAAAAPTRPHFFPDGTSPSDVGICHPADQQRGPAHSEVDAHYRSQVDEYPAQGSHVQATGPTYPSAGSASMSMRSHPSGGSDQQQVFLDVDDRAHGSFYSTMPELPIMQSDSSDFHSEQWLTPTPSFTSSQEVPRAASPHQMEYGVPLTQQPVPSAAWEGQPHHMTYGDSLFQQALTRSATDGPIQPVIHGDSSSLHVPGPPASGSQSRSMTQGCMLPEQPLHPTHWAELPLQTSQQHIIQDDSAPHRPLHLTHQAQPSLPAGQQAEMQQQQQPMQHEALQASFPQGPRLQAQGQPTAQSADQEDSSGHSSHQVLSHAAQPQQMISQPPQRGWQQTGELPAGESPTGGSARQEDSSGHSSQRSMAHSAPPPLMVAPPIQDGRMAGSAGERSPIGSERDPGVEAPRSGFSPPDTPASAWSPTQGPPPTHFRFAPTGMQHAFLDDAAPQHSMEWGSQKGARQEGSDSRVGSPSGSPCPSPSPLGPGTPSPSIGDSISTSRETPYPHLQVRTGYDPHRNAKLLTPPEPLRVPFHLQEAEPSAPPTGARSVPGSPGGVQQVGGQQVGAASAPAQQSNPDRATARTLLGPAGLLTQTWNNWKTKLSVPAHPSSDGQMGPSFNSPSPQGAEGFSQQAGSSGGSGLQAQGTNPTMSPEPGSHQTASQDAHMGERKVHGANFSRQLVPPSDEASQDFDEPPTQMPLPTQSLENEEPFDAFRAALEAEQNQQQALPRQVGQPTPGGLDRPLQSLHPLRLQGAAAPTPDGWDRPLQPLQPPHMQGPAAPTPGGLDQPMLSLHPLNLRGGATEADTMSNGWSSGPSTPMAGIVSSPGTPQGSNEPPNWDLDLSPNSSRVPSSHFDARVAPAGAQDGPKHSPFAMPHEAPMPQDMSIRQGRIPGGPANDRWVCCQPAQLNLGIQVNQYLRLDT